MRKKADIVRVGLMDPIRDWIFDCKGEIPGIEILSRGEITFYGGYTENELRKICAGKVKISWADPLKASPIGINVSDFGGPDVRKVQYDNYSNYVCLSDIAHVRP